MATKRAMKKQEKKIAAQTDIKETVEAVEETAAPVEEKEAAVETAEETTETVEAIETVEAVEEAEAAEEVKEVKKVRKPAAKKEVKTKIMIQHQGREVDSKDLIAAVKKEWTKSKHKVGDMKSMDLYIKPEDGAAYYVINGDVTGKIEF